MDTLVIERGRSNYLVNAARVVRSDADVSADLAASVADDARRSPLASVTPTSSVKLALSLQTDRE